jgi:WD40 repeat protein
VGPSQWNWTEKREEGPLRPDEVWTEKAITAVAYTPDGKYLVLGESGGAVTLWSVPSDLPSGRKQVHTFPGHDGAVLVVAFSADGRTLATGGDDSRVRLNDLGKVLDELAAGKKP